MSIQSTITLSREEAEQRVVEKLLDENYRKTARARAIMMDDKELEDFLDERFYNYQINKF